MTRDELKFFYESDRNPIPRQKKKLFSEEILYENLNDEDMSDIFSSLNELNIRTQGK